MSRSTTVRQRSNASEHASAAARTLLAGADAEPRVHVPLVSSHLDTKAGCLRLQSVTLTTDANAGHVLDSDHATGRALIAYRRARRLIDTVSLDWPRNLVALRTLIAQGAEFTGRLPACLRGRIGVTVHGALEPSRPSPGQQPVVARSAP